jgi:hypothetical protein
MQEIFLHFIWQFQYFDQHDLTVAEGEPLLVLRQGLYNRQDSGPDFKGAQLKIGQLDWHGDVEIHLRSSDWHRHHHEQDAAYNSVVLHVVWENDGQVSREDGSAIPVLVLKDRVDKSLLKSYEQLLESHYSIACTPQFGQAASISKVSMLDNALLQRLKRKSGQLIEWVEEAKGDWETVAWWLMAQNFGFKKNNEPFLRLARGLPLKVLAKHRSDIMQLEALLYGMAGFLEDPDAFAEPYRKKLQQEWQFLRGKYGLAGKQLRLQEWHFLRMRPANFPSLRLAQLAAIIKEQHHIFSLFSRERSVSEMIGLLRSPQSPYWQQHYNFGKGSAQKLPALGLSGAQILLINTAAPLLAAYGIYTDDESWIDRAMDLLQQIPAERNSIIDNWKSLDMKPQHAYDAQALIELHNEFCQPRKCLQCVIGLDLLKRRHL